jgi:hypothetical protein
VLALHEKSPKSSGLGHPEWVRNKSGAKTAVMASFFNPEVNPVSAQQLLC